MMQVDNNLKLCHLLLEEANLSGVQPLPDDSTACMNMLNEYRTEQHWPLVSGMSCLAVDLQALSYTGNFDFAELRAILQHSFIALFKQQNNALNQVVDALRKIQVAADEQVFGLMASMLQALLKNIEQFFGQQAIFDCLKRYDLLLKDWQHQDLKNELVEQLFLDISFYHAQLAGGSPQWTNDALAQEHLAKRTQYYALKLGNMVQAVNNETSLAKEKIFPLYLAVTDGLLFGQHFELRARLEARFQKLEQLDDPMLLIAIPAQKLWAECMRIGVNI